MFATSSFLPASRLFPTRTTVFIVSEPTVAEEEPVAAAEEAAAPEVIKEKKPETEGAAEAKK
jgi:hypothetical protein